MARFDVCPLANGSGLVLEVQADLLESLKSRVVVPLIPLAEFSKPAKRLNPVFEINGVPYVMASQFLAAISSASMNEPLLSLRNHDIEITNALDMVFSGF